MSWYDEENIKKKILNWLEIKGFTKEFGKKDKIHGIDIQRSSQKGCRYWFIECKGSPSKRYKKGLREGKIKPKQSISSQKYVWFTTAIGQIALRMKQKNGKYGVAFPDDKQKYFRNKILDNQIRSRVETCLKIFRKRTKLHFFLVNKDGKILQLTPNANKFKKVG